MRNPWKLTSFALIAVLAAAVGRGALTPAAALGMRTVLFKDAAQLRRDLAALGVVA